MSVVPRLAASSTASAKRRLVDLAEPVDHDVPVSERGFTAARMLSCFAWCQGPALPPTRRERELPPSAWWHKHKFRSGTWGGKSVTKLEEYNQKSQRLSRNVLATLTCKPVGEKRVSTYPPNAEARTLEPRLQNCAPPWMFCTRLRHFIKLDLDAAVRVYASASVIPGDASCISTACSALKEPTSIRLAPRAMPSVRTTCCTSTGVWALNMLWQATCSACIDVGEFWLRSRLPAGLCGTATAADRVGTAEGKGAAEGVVTRHGAVATSVAKQAGGAEGMGAAAGMGVRLNAKGRGHFTES